MICEWSFRTERAAGCSGHRALRASRGGPSMTPNGMLMPRCLVWCESVEMANLAPRLFAVRTMAPPRSSRSGLPLISRYTLRRAASVATRSKSNGNGSRFSKMRPVGWPITRMEGDSRARIRRSVISARFEIHVAVNASDHDVELGECVFGEIHLAVAADIAFEPGENAEREAVRLRSRTCLAKATARFSSRPLAMASAFE